MSVADSADALVLLPAPGGLPPEPEVGFVGRAAELHALTDALSQPGTREPVVVYGHEGVGKTTLVAHAARELVQSGRFGRAIYTRFAGGGYGELALYDLGQRLLGKEWTPQGKDAEEQVIHALQETPALIIWDHLEAFLPGGEGGAPAGAMAELLGLGARLTATGESRLCLLADSADAPHDLEVHAGPAHWVAVKGLAEDDGQTLLQALLVWQQAEDVTKAGSAIVRGLGGHPLALTLVAAAAATRPLESLLQDMESILPGFATGEALQRNQSLDVALETWLRTLDGAVRLQVLSLAPFVGGLMAPLGATVGLEEEVDWKTVVAQLTRAQVLRLSELPGLNAQYAFLAPGLTRRFDQRLTEPQRTRLEPRYYGAYMGLLKWMMEREAQAPQSMFGLFRCELPNLWHAARLVLASEQLSSGLQFVRQLQAWMARLGLRAHTERLGMEAKAITDAAVPKEGPLPRAGVQLLLAQAEQLYGAGQVPKALGLLAGLEKRVLAEKGLAYTGEEVLLDRGLLLHQLGRYLATARQHAEAIKRYTGAIEQLTQATQTERVRQELTNVYGYLGEAHLAGQQIDLAAAALRKGLDLAQGLQDRRLQGLIMVGQASVAGARGDDATAEGLLNTALEHLQAVDDAEAMIGVWEQLSVVALHKNDVALAEQRFEQALACAVRVGQPLAQAQVIMQMGRVAEAAGRMADARSRYERTVQLCREQKAVMPLLAAEMALAGVLLREGETLAAKEHAMEARALADQIGPQSKPWQTYDLLGRIAKAEGNTERLAHWRLAAIEGYAGSPEAKAAVSRWQKLTTAVLDASRGESLAGDAVEALEKLEAETAWQAFGGAIWRILAGERGTELYVELELAQAVVVRHILGELQKG